MRRVLFIDIPSVLNTSRAPYNFVVFDKDKMSMLKDIMLKAPSEIVFAPTLPKEQGLRGYSVREMNCLTRLMGALRPDWEVRWTADVAVAVSMFASKENRIESYAVVRYHDTPELEWQLTFPTRTFRTGIGLTEADAESVIRLLQTPINGDEIPMKVMTKSELVKIVNERFPINPAPEEMKVLCDDYTKKGMSKSFPFIAHVDTRARAPESEESRAAILDGRSGLGGFSQ